MIIPVAAPSSARQSRRCGSPGRRQPRRTPLALGGWPPDRLRPAKSPRDTRQGWIASRRPAQPAPDPWTPVLSRMHPIWRPGVVCVEAAQVPQGLERGLADAPLRLAWAVLGQRNVRSSTCQYRCRGWRGRFLQPLSPNSWMPGHGIGVDRGRIGWVCCRAGEAVVFRALRDAQL